jgi:acyl-CoA synthetase (AMP-forming)/AMP-acid ligase II
MLSHRNLLANAESILEYLNLGREDSILAALPFAYSYGNSVMLTHLLTGGTLVIENGFNYPKTILDLMHAHRVTGFSGVASMYALLANHSLFSSSCLPRLRYLTHAGGPMPIPLLDKVRARLPDKQFYIMYGQTEASARLTYLPPDDLDRKKGSVGIAIPGVSLKITGPAGNPCPPGETGEVRASGENIMMGYWKNGDPEVLEDGWLKTGDMGYLDEEGYLFLIGRNSDIIKSGAFRIHPNEIEQILLLHPSIEEAAVVGIEERILGEVIAAAVVLGKDARISERELLYFCSKRLAPHKRPRTIHFLDSLPKTASGKILRPQVRRLLA